MSLDTLMETEDIRLQRLGRIRTKGHLNYMKEREHMSKKHSEELARSGLVNGSLVLVDVAKQMGKLFVNFKQRRFPAVTLNTMKEGVPCQVKAKNAVLSTHIHRSSLTAVYNDDALKKEMDTSHMHNAFGMTLVQHLNSMWSASSSKPKCNCRGGCKTDACPCRKSGWKCGTDCHPAHCKKHPCCKNYK